MAVAPADHEIACIAPAVLAEASLEGVVERHWPGAGGYGETQRVWRLACAAIAAAGAWVNRFPVCFRRLGGSELRAAAAARIDQVLRSEASQRILVTIDSIRLEMYVSIPFEAELAEDSLELICEAGHAAFAIEVVDAQQPAATRVAGAQIAAGRGQQRAEMQRSGRRGGEAPAGRTPASGTSRRGRRTASRGVRAAPAPRCRASQPAGLRAA